MNNRKIVVAVVALLLMFVLIMTGLPAIDSIHAAKSAADGGSSRENAEYVSKVFQRDKVTAVNIEMDEKDLEDMLANPTKEEIHPGTVTIDGVTVSAVGIRTKGNSSLTSVASSDSDRYSFKIDFDYYQDGQSLYGMKKLNLNNNFSDASQIREYVSYTLMEEMGIPTPAFSYMYVTINGKDQGLYLGVEGIDQTFLQSYFTNWSGDLYKPDGTGSDLKWISDEPEDYTGIVLKTNEKSSDQKSLISMLYAINNQKGVEDVLNMDEIIRYFAANTALVSLDSYQGSMKHNYYLYEDNGKFSILPWDYNMSFGGFGVGMGGGNGGNRGQNGDNDNNAAQNSNNGAAGMPNFNDRQGGAGGMGGFGVSQTISDSAINFSISTPVSGTTLEERPLLNVIMSNEEYKAKFDSYLKEISEGFFSEDKISALVTQVAALIEPYVEKDPTKFYTLEEFKEGISGDNSIVSFAMKRAESIKQQLSGELVVDSQTSSTGFADFGGNMGGQGGPPTGAGSNNQPDNNQGGFPFSDNGGNSNRPPGRQGEGNNGGLPDGQNQQNGKFAPNMDRQGNIGPGQDKSQSIDRQTLFILAGSLVLLGLSILGARLFRRRGKYRFEQARMGTR